MTGNFHFPRNAFLGFDHLFDELERVTNHAKDSYPPHNVVKYDDMKYDIELAIAGFSKDDIDIELKDHVLSVKGERVLDEIKNNTFIKEYLVENFINRLGYQNTQKSSVQI